MAIVALAGLGIVATRVCPAVAAKPAAGPKLAPDQLRAVNKLLGEYRAATGDLDRREAICKEVLEKGPAAVPLMLATIEKDLRPRLRRCSGRFQQQAALAARKKVRNIDPAEVVRLRGQVLAIQRRGEGFTKEAIVRDGDPAMARLEALFVNDRAEILAQSTAVQADRKKLARSGKLWEQCQARLPPPPVADAEEPPKPPDFEEYLKGEERLAAALAMPMDPRLRAVLAVNARLTERIDPEEARAILACNLMRNLLGLSALLVDLKLCDAARDHSQDMEHLNFFAHESPVAGKKTPWERAKRFGTTASAENIAMGYRDGKAANDGWFHSPGHHKNMLAPDHTRIGIGRSGVYYTEEFGR